MIRVASCLAACIAFFAPLPAAASDDCKPHPLFTPMAGYHVYSCEYSEFDAKDIPVKVDEDRDVELETVEGEYQLVVYMIDEGGTPASPLKILRNHTNAARAKGATVVMEAGNHSFMAGEWADIQEQIATLRMSQGGKDYLVHLGSVNEGDFYAIASVSRQEMVQEVSVNELVEEFDRNGFLTLEVHFDTAKATIKPESAATLDQAAQMLKQMAAVKAEVGGHTDNVGNADANMALSQQRAESVRAALVERGVGADRLVAKGYGAGSPVADNRSEEGRARNRRVELVKR